MVNLNKMKQFGHRVYLFHDKWINVCQTELKVRSNGRRQFVLVPGKSLWFEDYNDYVMALIRTRGQLF